MALHHLLKRKGLWVFVLIMIGLSACSQVSVTEPTETAVDLGSTLTSIPIPSPMTSPTPRPAISPTPFQPSTATPTPAPTLSVYEDAVIYGYIMDETQVEVGSFDDRLL